MLTLGKGGRDSPLDRGATSVLTPKPRLLDPAACVMIRPLNGKGARERS